MNIINKAIKLALLNDGLQGLILCKNKHEIIKEFVKAGYDYNRRRGELRLSNGAVIYIENDNCTNNGIFGPQYAFAIIPKNSEHYNHIFCKVRTGTTELVVY